MSATGGSLKICFLSDAFLQDPSTGINGSQVQCYLLARGLAQRGHEVHYVCGTMAEHEAREGDTDGIALHWVAFHRRRLRLRPYRRRFSACLHVIRPDVLYVRGRSFLVHVAGVYAERHGARLVWASNGEDGCDPWKFTPRLLRGPRPAWKKLALLPFAVHEDRLVRAGVRRAHIVVNQTETQKAALWRHYGKNGCIIRSGHEIPPLAPKARNPHLVLWLANISRNKQPERFLELARRLKHVQGWRFVLVGGCTDASYFGEIEAAARDVGNMELTGKIDFEGVAAQFARASLFVSTSGYEGLPNTFIQAWLAGVPVLSLNVDPDGLLTKHRLGFCAGGHFDELVRATEALLLDDTGRSLWAEQVRAYAIRHFNLNVILDQYERLFRDCTSRA